MTDAPQRPRSTIGRNIVQSIFAAVIVWGLVAMTGSVLVELYGAPPANPDAGASYRERSWCVRRLAALHADLEAKVTAEAGSTDPAPEVSARWNTWQTRWSKAFDEAAGPCRGRGPDVAGAFERLAMLHERYDDGTERILSARAAAGAELDAEVRRLLPAH